MDKQFEEVRVGKVLIVEDEPDLAEIMAEDFRDRGYTVFSAPNGVVAMDVIETHSIDLVISDIHMPGGGGLQLLDRLKERGPGAPTVVLVTGFVEMSDFEVLERGALCILEKPIDRKRLCEIADEAVREATHERKFLHELSGPLGAALFMLDLASDKLVGEGEGASMLERAHRELEKMRRLIEQRRSLLIEKEELLAKQTG